MSFTENFQKCVEEIKQKRQQQEQEIGLYQNKLKFTDVVGELNGHFSVGKTKPSDIKPKSIFNFIWEMFI